jgi:hypothetical protein
MESICERVRFSEDFLKVKNLNAYDVLITDMPSEKIDKNKLSSHCIITYLHSKLIFEAKRAQILINNIDAHNNEKEQDLSETEVIAKSGLFNNVFLTDVPVGKFNRIYKLP